MTMAKLAGMSLRKALRKKEVIILSKCFVILRANATQRGGVFVVRGF